MIDPTFRNINRLFILSFKNGGDDPSKIALDKYYVTLVKIKDINAISDNKTFLDQAVKTNKKSRKNFLKCQETMIKH